MIIFSFLEIKKPPVAPKPKFAVANHKPAPPPIAPKPDVVVSGLPQSTKKAKPAVAPKPKALGSAPVGDIGQLPAGKFTRSLGELRWMSAESPDTWNCQPAGAQCCDDILPVSSCGSACLHEAGSGENLRGKQLVSEPLDTSENSESCRVDESRSECGSACERVRSQREVVLKASFLEEKLKGVLAHRVSPLLSSRKHGSPGAPSANASSRLLRIEFAGVPPALSSCEKAPDRHSCLPGDGCESTETCQNGSEKGKNHSHSLGLETQENGPRATCMSSVRVSEEPEARGLGPLAIHLVPYTPKFPTPKPRKTRTARLLRQWHVDTPGEHTEEPESVSRDSSWLVEGSLKNGNICVLPVNVLRDQGQVDRVKLGNKSDLNVESNSDTRGLVSSQKATCHKASALEKAAPPLDANSNLSSDSTAVDGSGVSLAMNKGTSFLRCSTLSMSLPTQLKLTCKEHLQPEGNLAVSAPHMQKESSVKEEASSRIAPKKPQRHSVPAAGLLKKAASVELVDKSLFPSNEENDSEKVLERSHLRHLCDPKQAVSSSFDVPKRTSEKPVWKLPHPILPFPGNPEALKSVVMSSQSEPSPTLTKPRAKSLSAMDTERCTKPCRDSVRKTSFRRLLSMKLSFGFLKSDLQKFWSRSGLLGDTGTGRPPSGAEWKGLEIDWRGLLGGEENRARPGKAHSVDSSGPESQKKRKRSRQPSAAGGPRAESLDDQMLSREPPQASSKPSTSLCAPEYENVRHYEEIPEYENLPFLVAAGKTPELAWQNSSSAEDPGAGVYEVDEPYEAPAGPLQLGPRRQHSSSGASQEGHRNLNLGDLPSDEEDASSTSSQGEPDPLEDRQDEDDGMKAKVHHIAKEIASSEKVFVDVLKLLHIDFRDAVAQASRQLGKPVVEERVLSQILYYLPQLYELNRDLLKELEERMLSWTEQQRIADIFVKKGPYLKMYSTYIKEFDKNIALLDEQCRKNPSFAAIVREFELSPRCASLALKHYLLKPVQRIPQYRLLLTDYLKNLREDARDYRDTQDALAVVVEVANHANDTMKQGDNFQKLMQIQCSLNGHHEIVQPGRVFLKEGTLMKLSRKVMQPRMFFLFNDALLYTTPVPSGMYKLNNMLSLAGMKVGKPTQEAYQNELKIESVERSFILSASSATERDEWLDAISRSLDEYAKKRVTFCPSRSLDQADSEEKEKASPLGSKAPIWIPDTRATMCMICTSEFTLTWRRHHCRACGKIVCQACSSNKCGLDYLKNQPARVCEHCFQELQKLDQQHSPKIGAPGNHKSTSSALSSVLHSIPSGRKQKKIPAALKEVSANTEDSSMSGYLYRSKGNKKPWKHLWFVIKNKVLYTYAASEDVAALESQPLLGFTVTPVTDADSAVFQLLHKNMLFYVFRADDAHSAQKWVEAFQEGTVL
ncbi:FYVE, RhoGEF and PH domain-containing protein 6 [Carlito syrichta]|uniref:FYVE, RhoGEF and PH domain-containing protein 6 n=1 Tax=Carlito syrichta TaxID=1868482 RepID=A0A1U7URC4_CARSF|nr:FYVE, RhoGEF and PH domain-containing protein 6 [Carlito syrichta]